MISMNLTAPPPGSEGNRFKPGNDRWISCLFLLLLLFFSPPRSIQAAGDISSGAHCPSHHLSDAIGDPRQWTLRCLDLAASPETLTQFESDIDHDGIPELFVSSTKIQGNAGSDYFVFQKKGETYSYLGSLFLHPQAFRVLPMETDQSPRMTLYRRSGAGQGTLVMVKYTGHEFAVVQKETIEPMGKDRARYEQIFGPALGSFRPELSPEEALKIVDEYVREKKVDLSRQYIHFIRLDYDPGAKRPGFYWRIHWRGSVPRMGGEYGLRIYMDRTVLPEIAGP
jgi:hypothetical protein